MEMNPGIAGTESALPEFFILQYITCPLVAKLL